jgi:cell division protease FtsH
VKARKQIFKVHVRNVPLSDDVNIGALAANSAGMTGADIRNVVNEAALWAARQNKTAVDSADFEHAYDKVTLGAKRDDLLNPRERKKAAYHEAGHAIAGWKLAHVDPIHKATIIARGRTGGRVQFRREDDQSNMSEAEINDWLVMALAGRAAEKLVFDDVNTGASNDLERATQLARNMVTQWGMSERLGPVSYKLSDDDPFLGREMHQQRQFSEHTMELIDEEVSRVLNESSQRATDLLVEHRADFEKLAQALLEREELTEAQIEEILGPPLRNRHREKHEDPAHLDHPDNSYLNVPTGGAPDRS